jgi:hypothetical protein
MALGLGTTDESLISATTRQGHWHGRLQRAGRARCAASPDRAHEVTNIGNDRSQLSTMARQAQQATGVRELTAIADRGYFKGEEILACEATGVTPLVPMPATSSAKADGRFGK